MHGEIVRAGLKPLKRALVLALVVLTGGLAGGLPLLDAHETSGRAGIERTHDASRCSFRHDHSVCIVFQQTPAAATTSSPFRPVAALELGSPLPRATFIASAFHRSNQSARAPPVLL